MITMEFDEMKKIWDAQNNQPLYVIDEKALHNRIQSKINTIRHFTSVNEWMLILINLGAGAFLLFHNHLFTKGANWFLGLEVVWMVAFVLYVAVHQVRRIRAGRRFDRSLHGDLDHGISIAGYQMLLSQIVRWNLLPTGMIMLFSGWESGQLFKVSVVILVSYTLAFYVTSKGYQANKRRKRALQVLKEKLETGI